MIDCGLFHTFGDEERPMYVQSLAQVVSPGGVAHLLCFSDQEPPGEGPRRVTQQEIHSAFRDGWDVEAIRDDAVQGDRICCGAPIQPRRSQGLARHGPARPGSQPDCVVKRTD